MSVLIEGISVVVRNAALESKYPGGVRAFCEARPNPTLCADAHLCRIGFLDPGETEAFAESLEHLGLVLDGPGGFQDLAIVDQVNGLPLPCSWLEFAGAPGEPARAWLRGTDPGPMVVPENWTFEHSLSRRFGRAHERLQSERLEFLRQEGDVDVYRDRETGAEVFLGRAAPTLPHE